MASKGWDTPTSLWYNGKLTPWDQCVVHATSAYAQRGASIFEGIRVYKIGNTGDYLAFTLKEHLNRLENSWRSLSLPNSFPSSLVSNAIAELLSVREMDDCYCRITKFLDVADPETRIEKDGMIIALYNSQPLFGRPVTCLVSPWRRDEFALPAQIKIGGHYFLMSWVRQQARQLGADEAILVNREGFVSEATGTAVFLFANGELATPPISDGALPSITAKIVLHLASNLGIRHVTRTINRTELFGADAVFLAGTLDELRPVSKIDTVDLPNALECSPVAQLFGAFSDIRRSRADQNWGKVFQTKPAPTTY